MNSRTLELFEHHPVVKAMAKKVQTLKPGEYLYAEGLQGSAAAAMLSGLPANLPESRAILVILHDHDEAAYFYNDLISLQKSQESRVSYQSFFFPSPYRRGVKYAQIDPANEIMRTDTLSAVLENSKDNFTNAQLSNSTTFIVTYPEALSVKVVTRSSLQAKMKTFRVGETYDFAGLESELFTLGFQHVDYVYEPGQFAIRGSIIDIFSYSSEHPYRLDFFGDELDSIRTFDVETQLSVERVDTVTVVPLVAATDDRRVSFLQFLPSNALLVQKNPSFIHDRIAQIYAEGFSAQALIEREATTLSAQSSMLNNTTILLSPSDFATDIAGFPSIILSGSPATNNAQCSILNTQFSIQPQPFFHKNFDIINTTLADYQQRGYHLYILADNPEQHQRLAAIFEETGAPVTFTPVQLTLHAGFVDDTLKACFFTDHQIFDRFHRYRLKAASAANGKLAHSLRDMRQFEPGDYVIHVDHGVGQFMGLVTVTDGNSEQERMKLQYKNGDIVYVSVHSLNKVSKYRSSDSEPPALSRLGTGAWNQLKERTKTKIKDIARDLIRLYSERRRQQGFAFSPDTYMQHELEASFIYEDTPDQLKVTAEIKRDMESPRPMDRLVCGDVGFGKTELAVRAALKAATDGKQVAVLVPTTLLAYQHYLTFTERLRNFPVTIEYLTRAQSPKKASDIIQRIADGKVEIVIGTHKLLGKTVRFHDLGLLIIDEEQKFGVATKEKLRQLKVNVDTLTLTATPIPRTLQFSLMGARDLSVLTTPPANRYPIHTEVHIFSHEVIADAINFELSRQGQVFFVCNRIASLPHIQQLIAKYVPDARVAIGHGQMPPEQLERIITDFIRGDYDVLLSTTIVENGIDIPNANTIIIDNAHRFGLSDLHQMRGRVGRTNRKAFCYLLTQPLATLPVESRRRLEALESYSDLGSGLQIAMQDLDIRGAGNLLGAEQSGFIADLGYETYQKILTEAVQELKTDEFPELEDSYSPTKLGGVAEGRGGVLNEEACQESRENIQLSNFKVQVSTIFETDLPLYLPDDYIPGSSERVQLYREIDALTNQTSNSQISNFKKNLSDRFGPLPQPVEDLLKVPGARALAGSLGIERIVAKGGSAVFYFVGRADSPYYQSDLFGRVLKYAIAHFADCKISEHNGHRRMTVHRVPDIDTLITILRDIATQE
ncbi:MAG: transcription-repair coupling factor [Bacteroidaceae bacterium]|nr:transcription-repair coupling factor [Bacteroidaceae bacterium]